LPSSGSGTSGGLTGAQHRTGDQGHEPLGFTPAEARVLPLLATYLTLGGIADRLGVRRSTVKTHVVSIYKKLGAANRAEAVERAAVGGFLDDASAVGPSRSAQTRSR
jgi:LuxR family maltose regulon positive regulatory protein